MPLTAAALLSAAVVVAVPLSFARRAFATHTTAPLRSRGRKPRGKVLPGTVTYTVNPIDNNINSNGSSSFSSDSRGGASGGGGGFKGNRTPSDLAALPALRCPGGPRIKAEGIKQLFKVPHAGILAQYDQRFVLNLKLTHQIASHLSRTTLRTSDKVLLELGPGAGSLTRSLLTRPCVGVVGVECDERFNAHLEQIRSYTRGKFQWINADVLALDEVAVVRRYFPEFARRNIRSRTQERGDVDDENIKNNNNTNSNENGSSTVATADDDGYEGAPLRSSQRDWLLRQRQSRNPFANAAVASSPSSNSNSKRQQEEPSPARRNISYNKHGGDESKNTNTNTNTGDSAAAFAVTDRWWSDGDAKVEVVANLPFSIITELLMRYAVDCSRRQGLFSFGRVPLHIFTQKEVADRITAPAGSIHFSKLSVLSQAFFHVKVQQVFTEWTFYPKTEVLGAMLTLEPRVAPLGWSASTLSTATVGGGGNGKDNYSYNNATSRRGGGSGVMPLVDGAALIHFTDLLMKGRHRGATIHKALSAFMPPEVVQYVLQASRMDGAMTVLDLSVEELVRMAGMWRTFLTASQQQQQRQQRQEEEEQ